MLEPMSRPKAGTGIVSPHHPQSPWDGMSRPQLIKIASDTCSTHVLKAAVAGSSPRARHSCFACRTAGWSPEAHAATKKTANTRADFKRDFPNGSSQVPKIIVASLTVRNHDRG